MDTQISHLNEAVSKPELVYLAGANECYRMLLFKNSIAIHSPWIKKKSIQWERGSQGLLL